MGVYIDGRIDLQIKRTTGINWLDRLSRNVVFYVLGDLSESLHNFLSCVSLFLFVV